jgi:ubiquitin thioesterase OTU1
MVVTDGHLVVLRIMPSDNSCLFTAFGGALPTQIPAPRLRKMMADFIAEHPGEYTEAVLGSSPAQYSRSIQDPDRWGGGIELSILSSIFDIEICTFDVQASSQQSVPMREMLTAVARRKI